MIDIFLWHPNHISWYDIISTHGTSFSGHEVEFVVRYTISVFTKINLPTPIEISWSFRVLYFHICCSKHAIERWFDLVGISFYNLTILLDLPWAFRVLYAAILHSLPTSTVVAVFQNWIKDFNIEISTLLLFQISKPLA